jgi:hypothetical protein
MNGRIDIMGNTPAKPFQLYDDDVNVDFYQQNSLNSIQTNSLLSKTYFGRVNFEQLQNMIRYNVYLQSGKRHIIGRQSDMQLQIIMRSIYLQNSKNQENNISEQIKELNKMVLDFCVPNILVGIEQYQQYKVSVSTHKQPIPLAQSTNQSNNKELDMTKNLFI